MSHVTTLIAPQAPPAAPPKPFTAGRFFGNVFLGVWLALTVGIFLMITDGWDPEKFAKYGPSYLSGLVIGAELHGAAPRPDAPVVLIGSDTLTARYARALDVHGKNAITREETRGDVDFTPRFDDMDINRDGVVTLDELRGYIDRRYGVKPADGS